MKRALLLTALLLALFAALRSNAQTPCSTQGCNVTTVNISTGYDQSSGTYKTPLAIESNWELIAVPTNASVTLPGPTYVIAPHPAWGNFPNAKWLSPFQSNSYYTNNPPLSGYGPFTFQHCFCLCRATAVHFKYKMLVDDEGATFVDGILLADGTQPGSGHYGLGTELVVDTTITLGAGTHCLTADVYNVGSVAMGFAIEGVVDGATLLSSLCCDPTGKICGQKLNDQDCDGRVDPTTDPGLQGWTIELYDSLGNLIASAVTDPQGNYCFTGLKAGHYYVKEVNQPGWTQTYPSSGSHYVSLPPAGAVMASFGNCQPPEPCDVKPEIEVKIDKCAAQFIGHVSSVASGYTVVATTWTFDDGYSSTELNPLHFYADPGTYKVCFTVTVFNGKECCTRTVCKEVKIDEPCKEGCKIQGDIKIDVDSKHCIYNLLANITYSGLPITSYYWDFGDGTYGTGQSVAHHYPGSGVFPVCVYVFASNREDCCVQKICTEIEVRGCEGNPDPKKVSAPPVNKGSGMMRQGSTMKPGSIVLSDKNSVVLNQNVPNPFAESTVITYNIPMAFNKAQIVFTNVSGKTVKAFDITTKGEGQLNVYANDLSTGIYTYSLLIDGKVMESRNMLKQ